MGLFSMKRRELRLIPLQLLFLIFSPLIPALSIEFLEKNSAACTIDTLFILYNTGSFRHAGIIQNRRTWTVYPQLPEKPHAGPVFQ